MKYYFGKVPAQDVEVFGGEDLFELNGEYFYNAVEVGSNPGGTEDFVIYDTCGRNIPIGVDMIAGLARVLLDINNNMNTIYEARILEQELANENTIVTFE